MKTVLLVVLPQIVGSTETDGSKKIVKQFLAFPYGVITLASYLKRFASGLDSVEILDLNLPNEKSPDDLFKEKLEDMQPHIVGFSMSYDVSYPWLQKLTRLAKRHSDDIVTVAGGPAVTTAYTEILNECSNLDACCYSEGEIALKNLVETGDLSQDPWITWERIKCVPHSVYGDLDEIVDVDYSLVDVPAYSMKEAFSPFTKFTSSSKQFFIVTSRGCPFKCVFCAEPSFHGANMRYVSVDKVVSHVTMLVEKYGLSVLTIYDDQILMNKARAKELFSKLIPLKIRIEMPNGVTLSYIDQEMAEVMKAAGVDTLFLAIEHGSKRVLKDIIRKPISFQRIKPTIQLLQAVGIYCQGFFVIGLPGETREERRETRDIIIDWGLDWASFSYATPLRGSELFRTCKANGWIDPKFLPIGAIDMTKYCIRSPGIDPEEIEQTVLDMNLYCNFVNNRNMRVGNYKTAQWAFKEVLNRFPRQAFAHYYMAQCLEKTGQPTGNHYQTYLDLVKSTPSWMDAAKRFGLETEVEHTGRAWMPPRNREGQQYTELLS